MDIIADKKIESAISTMNEIARKNKLTAGLDYFMKAESLRNSELYNESVRFYLSSLLIEKDNLNCYLGLAKAYKHTHEYEKAISTLHKANKINKKIFEIHYELGILFLLCETPCAAIKEFQKAIMLDKTRIEAQIQLAKAHEVLGEYDMAELVYNRIIELNPTHIEAYNNFANMYMNLELYIKAGAIYRQLLKMNPNFSHAYFALGVCFEKLGKTTDAIRHFKKFTELKPNSINSTEIKRHIYKLKEQQISHTNNMKLIK